MILKMSPNAGHQRHGQTGSLGAAGIYRDTRPTLYVVPSQIVVGHPLPLVTNRYITYDNVFEPIRITKY